MVVQSSFRILPTSCPPSPPLPSPMGASEVSSNPTPPPPPPPDFYILLLDLFYMTPRSTVYLAAMCKTLLFCKPIFWEERSTNEPGGLSGLCGLLGLSGLSGLCDLCGLRWQFVQFRKLCGSYLWFDFGQILFKLLRIFVGFYSKIRHPCLLVNIFRLS